MELWQLSFLIIVLTEYSIHSNGVIDPNGSDFCNASFLNIPFPVHHVPERQQFRLILHEAAGSDLPFENQVCLEKSDILIANLCNLSNSNQLWFQYESYLISMQNGLAVVPQDFQPGSFFNFTSHLNGEYTWNCDRNYKDSVVLFIRDKGVDRLYISKSSADERSIILNDQTPSFWTISSTIGTKIENYDGLCKKRHSVCYYPLIGSESFVLFKTNVYNSISRLPKNILNKILQSNSKACYNVGESVFYSCIHGFIKIGTENQTFEERVCLGGDEWSTGPLHCVKQSCGVVPVVANSILYDENVYEYGERITFKCKPGYKSDKYTLLCGPHGEWIGLEDGCKSVCNETKYKSQGYIISPNYPNPYPVDIQCRWRVQAPKGIKIAFWFRDFYIEIGSIISPYCRSDFLFFREMITRTEFDLSRLYCGSYFPTMWISKVHIVDVIFVSDFSFSTKGFKLQYGFWNSSKTVYPEEPPFNFSDPVLLDDRNVHHTLETFRYILEGCYSIIVLLMLCFILFIIAKHTCERYGNRILPKTIDTEAMLIQRRSSAVRRNAMSQCTESNLVESMSKSSSTVLLNETSLMQSKNLSVVAREIETFWEMSGDVNSRNQTRFVTIAMNDVSPPTVISETNIAKQFADFNCTISEVEKQSLSLAPQGRLSYFSSKSEQSISPMSPVEIVLTSADDDQQSKVLESRKTQLVSGPSYQKRITGKFNANPDLLSKKN